MKRILLLTCMLLTNIFCLTSAQTRVVKHPFCRQTTAQEINIAQVILSKTMTTVTMHISYMQSWNLKPTLHLTAGNKTYAFRSGSFYRKTKGKWYMSTFTLGKTITGKDEYEIGTMAPYDSLVLHFAPLPMETKSFDFIEGTYDSASGQIPWLIWGVKLGGKPYPCALKEATAAEKAEAMAPSPTPGQSVVYGHLYGYRKELGQVMRLMYKNVLTGEEDGKCSIDADGNFRIVTTPIVPKFISVVILEQEYKIAAVPNDVTRMDADLTTLLGIQSHTFNLKILNGETGLRFYGRYAPLDEMKIVADDDQWNNRNRIDPLKYNFKDCMEKMWDIEQDNIRKAQQDKRYTSAQRYYRKALSEANYLRVYTNYLEDIHDEVEWHNMSELKKGEKPLSSDKYKQEYTLVDSHAKDISILRDTLAVCCHDISFMEYMKSNGYSDSHPYHWLAELKQAKEMASRITEGKTVDENDWKKASPYYVPILKSLQAEMDRVSESISSGKNGVTVKETPKVTGDKLIESIVAAHPGQNIMFDLWATWCGPCKAGVAAMEPVKKEFAGQNIVFVYITNETSPMGLWKKMISAMPGEHYRIPTPLFNSIPNMSGIPQYYFYDKTGKKVYEQTGFESADKFVEVIKGMIGK